MYLSESLMNPYIVRQTHHLVIILCQFLESGREAMPIYIARNSKEQTKRNKLTLTLFHSHTKSKLSSQKNELT